MTNSQQSSALPQNLPTPTDCIEGVSQVECRADQIRPICERHGCEKIPWAMSAANGGEMTWRCPTCDDEAVARAARKDHERTDQARRDDALRRKQEALEKRIGAACIPARYRDYTFDTFPGGARFERAKLHCNTLRSYASQWPVMKAKGISVLLLGGTGTGKTGLACSVGNHIMREFGETVLFMSAYGAVRHQRDTWGRRGRTEREALDDLMSPDLLILDEVGASVGTEAEMTSLYEVFNGRYADRKPTIVLSNLPIEDYDVAGVTRPGLLTYLGPRILDRFRDDGSFTLTFTWPSLRGAQA